MLMVPVLLILLTSPASCIAHDIDADVLLGGVGIEVKYDGGAPMSWCDVEVRAPGGKETMFQEGTTDRNGRFFFCPDTCGAWSIRVDDGMGHAIVETVELDEDLEFVAVRGETSGACRVSRAIGGIGAILGIFGAYSLLVRRSGTDDGAGEE